MKKALMAVAVMAVGSVVWSMRQEGRRYLAIRRSSSDPSMVGHSITPQGNQAVAGRSERQRRGDRERAGTPPHW
jgi:hypothetical protein